VRLHHVFEHFPRAIACALLSSWQSWLIPEGIVRIEIPNFHRTAWILLLPFASFKRRAVAERHLFGSHEAKWAAHCEGYTPRTMGILLKNYGFEIMNISKNRWKGIHNFEMIAGKGKAPLSRQDCSKITQNYLSHFLIDQSQSELRLLDIWMEAYNKQLDVSWARDG
jgi:hypothetical protein